MAETRTDWNRFFSEVYLIGLGSTRFRNRVEPVFVKAVRSFFQVAQSVAAHGDGVIGQSVVYSCCRYRLIDQFDHRYRLSGDVLVLQNHCYGSPI